MGYYVEFICIILFICKSIHLFDLYSNQIRNIIYSNLI